MKRYSIMTLFCLLWLNIVAQAPHSFSYQAIARDLAGNVLANQSVAFRLSILSGSISGTAVYSELHSKTTNGFGLVDFEIGKGTSPVGTFPAIDWGNNIYFLKVEMDPGGGTSYTNFGTSQLLSVPYALYAKDVQNNNDADASPTNEIQNLTLTGTTLGITNGNSVTLPSGAGDNWGSQVVATDISLSGNGLAGTPLKIADNGVISSKIADNSILTADLTNNVITSAKITNLAVTTDKINLEAVTMDKIANGAVTNDKLAMGSVTTDKINNSAVTGSKIAQLGATSGQVLGWTGTTWAPQTVSAESGPWLSSGHDIYFNAGKVGIGKIPGTDSRQFQVLTDTYQAIAGVNNSTLGTIFAQNNGTGPAADFRNKLLIADGTQGAGKVLTSDAGGYTSWQTPAVITDGTLAGQGNVLSPLKLAQNGAIQGQVLKWTGTTWDNANDDHGPFYESTEYIYAGPDKDVGIGTAIPTQKLTLADGSSPCYMNIQNVNSGYTSYDGMFLGMSGLNSYVSSYEAGSLYLGTNADIRMAIVSDGKVGIGTLTPAYKLDVKGAANLNKTIASGPALAVNSDEAIWYDGTYFSWGYGGLFNVFHDPVGIACQPGEGHMLAVNGVASKPGGGTWAAFSDIRLKDVHGNYARGLEDILRLKPVRFNYKKDNPLNLPSEVEYVGFIAQDVQKVFPETVTQNKNGYLELDMSDVNAALINAFKELNAKVEALQKENILLKTKNEQISVRMERLERIFGESASADFP